METTENSPLSQINDSFYSMDKVKKSTQVVEQVTPEKKKIFLRVEYENGVKKQHLIGILKNGKLTYNKGVDLKKL